MTGKKTSINGFTKKFKYIIILSALLLSLISCKKDEIDESVNFTITTTHNGLEFQGVISGNVPFKEYKCGFRIVDESQPLIAYTKFCPSNMNKTTFSETLVINKTGTFQISAEIIECDLNMKGNEKKIIGTKIIYVQL